MQYYGRIPWVTCIFFTNTCTRDCASKENESDKWYWYSLIHQNTSFNNQLTGHKPNAESEYRRIYNGYLPLWLAVFLWQGVDVISRLTSLGCIILISLTAKTIFILPIVGSWNMRKTCNKAKQEVLRSFYQMLCADQILRTWRSWRSNCFVWFLAMGRTFYFSSPFSIILKRKLQIVFDVVLHLWTSRQHLPCLQEATGTSRHLQYICISLHCTSPPD